MWDQIKIKDHLSLDEVGNGAELDNAIHETEFHSDSPQRKSRNKNKICQISENSEYDASSDSETDVELSKRFELDVKDETEDDIISTDDEFNGKTK